MPMSLSDRPDVPDPSRRGVLRACGAFVALAVARPARADANELQAAIAAYTGRHEVKPGRVTIDVARLVDNGNAVPITVRVDSPMTAADHVRAIALLTSATPSATSRASHCPSAPVAPLSRRASGSRRRSNSSPSRR